MIGCRQSGKSTRPNYPISLRAATFDKAPRSSYSSMSRSSCIYSLFSTTVLPVQRRTTWSRTRPERNSPACSGQTEQCPAPQGYNSFRPNEASHLSPPAGSGPSNPISCPALLLPRLIQISSTACSYLTRMADQCGITTIGVQNRQRSEVS
jgi:hypothetical protein